MQKRVNLVLLDPKAAREKRPAALKQTGLKVASSAIWVLIAMIVFAMLWVV